MRHAVIVALIGIGALGTPGVAHGRPAGRFAVATIEYHSHATRIPVAFTATASGKAAPRRGWCENEHTWARAESLVGVWLWTLHERLIWCHTVLPDPIGSVVTLNLAGHGPNVATWATLPAWSPWDYEGVISTRNNGGVGESFVYRWRQAKFKLCAHPLPICQTRLPWLSIKGYGDGTSDVGGGW